MASVKEGIKKKQKMFEDKGAGEQYGIEFLTGVPGILATHERAKKEVKKLPESYQEDINTLGDIFLPPVEKATAEAISGTWEDLGTSGEASGGGETATTTGTTSPAGPEDPNVEQTIADEVALRKIRRRLRDRFGRRATRGGRAEMVGTGYSLGG
jgi:hypothetical protein